MTFERDPQGPRPVLQRPRRGALAPTLLVLGVLVMVALLVGEIWTDVLWYQSTGFLSVYRTEQLTRLGLFVLGAAVMAGGVISSLAIAYRTRMIYPPMAVEQSSLERYRESLEPLRRLVVVALPAMLGLFAGSAAAQQWQTVLLFLNRVPFGSTDAQFGLDIGFFVFSLPMWEFLSSFLSAVVFLSGLIAVATYYLYGGLRLSGEGPRISKAARVHLSVLAALFLLLRAVDYWLGRFALTTQDSRLITGLTYTDANAVLTARGVLAGIATVLAVLFLVAIVVARLRVVPLFGVALLVVSAIVIGGIYPAAVQSLKVTPNAKVLEAPYIKRNIEATRAAYGLDDIEVIPYTPSTVVEPSTLRESADSVPGIRLLDPSLISDTYRQLQQLRQYYSFPDSLDVDRYQIDGESQDAVVAVRELDIESAPAAQRNWINDHVIYTHGFGFVAAYGNQRSSDGKPVFFQRSIPVTGPVPLEQPRVYFGEKSPDYSIVGAPEGSAPKELDYPDDSGQQNTTYTGSGGVGIGSTFRKLLYALKFREGNLLLSNEVNPASKILYHRTPRERVERVAPFVSLDGDPYPAIVDGRITWILDGYTTSSRYPYSRSQILQDATSDSITARSTNVVSLDDQRINYIRNSVKATVDAYDGTVTLYAWDETDPVLQAWRKVFPDAVKPLSDIDGDLMAHLRYPEDLFKVQREVLKDYHVSDEGAFFDQTDFWTVPDDPSRESTHLQPPYYLTLRTPGEDDARFSLTSSFIPAGGERNVLTGYLTADADAGDKAGERRAGYGKLRLLRLPKDTAVPGPGQVQNAFVTDPTAQSELGVLQRSGSTSVIRGNLLTVPFGGSLLYVQPVYVRSTGGSSSYPLLQKIMVAYGESDKIGYANTLKEALDQVFGTSGGSSGSGSPGGGGDSGGNPSPDTGADDARSQLSQALQDASQALKDSESALEKGDFAAYGEAQERLQRAVEAAQAADERLSSQPAPAPSASSSPAPSAAPSVSTAGAATG